WADNLVAFSTLRHSPRRSTARTEMSSIPVSNIDDRPVDTKRMAEILTEAGYPTAGATLTKYRCLGGGPEYIKYSRSVRYVPSKAIAWAAERAQILRNTSEQRSPRPPEAPDVHPSELAPVAGRRGVSAARSEDIDRGDRPAAEARGPRRPGRASDRSE